MQLLQKEKEYIQLYALYTEEKKANNMLGSKTLKLETESEVLHPGLAVPILLILHISCIYHGCSRSCNAVNNKPLHKVGKFLKQVFF